MNLLETEVISNNNMNKNNKNNNNNNNRNNKNFLTFTVQLEENQDMNPFQSSENKLNIKPSLKLNM
jgi:hypothetical protein